MKLEKYCTGCKNTYPTTPEYWNKDYESKDGLKHHCRNCIREYNQDRMQNTLHAKYGTDDRIKICSCGRYYNSVHGTNRKKDRCTKCLKDKPLVRVYIPALREYYMARIDE